MGAIWDIKSRLKETIRGVKARGDRAVFGGGQGSPADSDIMEYVQISTLGDVTDFGNLTARRNLARASSSTRGVFAMGYIAPTQSDVIDYITFASTGDATDFGNGTDERYGPAGASSDTRGVFA